MRRWLVCACFAFAACSDSGSLGPGAQGGMAEIFIGVDGGISASVAASVVGGAPPVDFSQVTSLELVIERVEAHRVGGGGWTSIDLEPTSIDLAALSAGAVEPVAAGGLPEGTYNNVRFFFQSATISFGGDVTVGAELFAGGQSYDLDIPSVETTGLKVPTAHFTVGAGTEAVVVLFDPNGSTASIGSTGSGRVRMSPVFREADRAEEEAEQDGSEEGEESGEEDGGSASAASGSASLWLGASPAGSSSIGSSPGGRLAMSMLPPGSGVAAGDVSSLRLVLCEIRAVRTGGKDEPEGEGETGETGDTSTGDSGSGETGDGSTGDGTSEGEAGGDVDEEPPCLGRAAGAGWTALPLEASEIDLFALAEGEVVELAAGELPAGRYRNVRLYYSEAWITFSTDVTLGSQMITADTEVELHVPGAQNTGIKIPASHFEVGGELEEAMLLYFDQSSVSSLKNTGQEIRMSPIFREAAPAEEEELTEGEDEGA